MRKTLFVLTIFCLVLSSVALFAKEWPYKIDGKTVFKVSIPDNWTVETEDTILHASPNNADIYLGIWVLEEVESIDEALDALDKEITQIVDNLEESGEPEEFEINGIPFMGIEGTGTVEGEDVNVAIALFSPEDDVIGIVVYFGTPADEEKYSNDLIGIVNSIKK